MGGLGTYWFTTDVLQPTLCPIFDAAPKCVGQFERYNEAEATDLFSNYLGEAGGGSPAKSVNYFDTPKPKGVSGTELIELRKQSKDQAVEQAEKRWGDVLAAGMTEKATALEDFNWFQVRYQTFQGKKGSTDKNPSSDGSIINWQLAVRLTQDVDDDNEVKILKILEPRPLSSEKAHFPKITARKATMALKFPTKVSNPTGAYNWPAEGQEFSLCQSAVPSGSDHYWYRTRLGWVDGSVFTIEKEERRVGHPWGVVDAKPVPCPKFAAERATELEQAGD